MLLIIMVVTIQEILRPLLIMYFIMGLGAYPKQQNPRIRWIAYLSILYRLTIWFSYAYLLYYTITCFTWNILYRNIINRIIMVINTTNTIISVIMSFYHQKRLEMNFKKLSAVENSLEELGVAIMYQRIHSYSKLAITGWIVCSLAINFCDTMWWTRLLETNSWRLFLAHVLNYCFHINAFVELLFIFLLWYIGTRFDKVHEHIRYLLVREDHNLRCKKSIVALHRYTLCTNYKQTLWTSMHLHLELCRITRELNFIFGTQITFGIATYLILMMSLCYGISMMLMQELPKELLQSLQIWFNVIAWIFIILIRIYAINYICESVMIKANKINRIIHQLTNILRYADVWKEIYQFTLQAMHHPLKLTGMNLFYLGNECFRKFCITIVTFVIIMAQIKICINPYGR